MAKTKMKRKRMVRVRRKVPTELQMILREAKHLRRISRITKSERRLRLTESTRLVSPSAGD